jgi:hypothetical protein
MGHCKGHNMGQGKGHNMGQRKLINLWHFEHSLINSLHKNTKY